MAGEKSRRNCRNILTGREARATSHCNRVQPGRSILMNAPIHLFASTNLFYIWEKAPIEGRVIIVILIIFSIFAWSVMVSKGLQMSRAKKLNSFFDAEFRNQT